METNTEMFEKFTVYSYAPCVRLGTFEDEDAAKEALRSTGKRGEIIAYHPGFAPYPSGDLLRIVHADGA